MLHGDGHHAGRRPAQAVGVLGARGRLAAGEGGRDVVHLLGRGQQSAGHGLRHHAAGRVGKELLPDGLGHLGMMSLHERVRLAHDAFQVGELAHHDRHLVGLCQPGGFERALPGFAGSAGHVSARYPVSATSRSVLSFMLPALT